MKRILIWGGIGLAAFLVWQYVLSLQDPEKAARDQNAKDADLAGRIKENIGLAARPRLSDSESLWRLEGILTNVNLLWSQITGSGEVITGPDKKRVQPSADPFIFGFGNN